MSDIFRKSYKPMSEASAKLILSVKEAAEKLQELFVFLKSREMALATTNLEQAIMWATKAIALHDEQVNI